MNLIEFLTVRLDEDEAIARGAARTDDGHDGRWLPIHFGNGGFDARVDDHIARHDPARVLREVAAMRAILDEHGPGYPVTFPKPSGQPTCGVCHAGGWDWESEQWPCPTVRHLAAVWSDHPEYRPEWSPPQRAAAS